MKCSNWRGCEREDRGGFFSHPCVWSDQVYTANKKQQRKLQLSRLLTGYSFLLVTLGVFARDSIPVGLSNPGFDPFSPPLPLILCFQVMVAVSGSWCLVCAQGWRTNVTWIFQIQKVRRWDRNRSPRSEITLHSSVWYTLWLGSAASLKVQLVKYRGEHITRVGDKSLLELFVA